MPAPDPRPSTVARQIKIGAQTYNVKFNFSALGVLEKLYDCKAKDLGAKLTTTDGDGKTVANLGVGDVVNLIYAGALKQHPGLTVDHVIDTLDAALEDAGRGYMEEILRQTMEAFTAGQEAGGSSDPRPPA